MVGQNLNFESFQGACSNFERGILVPLAVASFNHPPGVDGGQNINYLT